ncbi:MAG TPA: hypothetical protein VK524_11060, partial [Polyangiaceae bacterium]|nr:hypothetical protein [Polyangiaceae bacterium]
HATRTALLCDAAVLIGASWARGWCEEMSKTGRAVEGGWPGTLPEARTRVAEYFRVECARRRISELSPDELATATRSAYDQAKREWLRVTRGSMAPQSSSQAAPSKSAKAT